MKNRRTHLQAVIWFTFAFLLGVLAGQQQAIADSMPKEEFEQRLRDYLLAHPEVVVEALQAYEARQKQAQEDAVKAALAARADEVFRDPASPVGANVEGSITLVEFFDYNCPYCRQMVPLMAKAEAAEPQLRIVYKEFPILGPGSIFAAKAALAANLQGGYTKFHKALYEVRGRVTEAVVLEVAADVGLDVGRLKTDMQSAAIQASVDRNLQLAQDLGITGTPAFIAGDQILGGAVDLATLTQLIEQARPHE
jgi:protein-disulfide isomerase